MLFTPRVCKRLKTTDVSSSPGVFLLGTRGRCFAALGNAPRQDLWGIESTTVAAAATGSGATTVVAGMVAAFLAGDNWQLTNVG